MRNTFNILIVLFIAYFIMMPESSAANEFTQPTSAKICVTAGRDEQKKLNDSENEQQEETTQDNKKEQPDEGKKKEKQRKSMNAIYYQLFGYGIVGSIGYERLFTDWLGFNVNFGYYPIQSLSIYPALYFPLNLNQRLYAEGGAQVAFKEGKSTIIGIFGFGYNFHPMNGGFYFKTGLNFFILNGPNSKGQYYLFYETTEWSSSITLGSHSLIFLLFNLTFGGAF